MNAVLETIFDLVVAILDVGLKELEHRVGDLALVEIGQVGFSECHGGVVEGEKAPEGPGVISWWWAFSFWLGALRPGL